MTRKERKINNKKQKRKTKKNKKKKKKKVVKKFEGLSYRIAVNIYIYI